MCRIALHRIALYCTVGNLVPLASHDHVRCQRKAAMAYEKQHGCSLLAFLGTINLVIIRPACGRGVRFRGKCVK